MGLSRYIELAKCSIVKARRNLRYLGRNPNLDYLETHLVDHCNMNCKGCSHFSPIATPWFADITSYRNDMERLSQLLPGINKIRLLGGEPLLHPQVEEFMSTTRKYFPSSEVVLVTNGLLLEKMNESFWDCCRNNSIAISITVYPPLKDKLESITRLLKEKKVDTTIQYSTAFVAGYNLKGDSNPSAAFKKCRSFFYCPFLRKGKIYVCRVPALAHNFNDKFGIQIPTENFLDIYSRDYTSKEIIRFLNRPFAACRFCSTRRPEFLWTRSGHTKEEWDDASVL